MSPSISSRRRSLRASEPAANSVLVVCTGNICRSPYVAGMLAMARPDLSITSAGTRARPTAWPEPPVAAALAAAGAPRPALSRRLTRAMAREAETILTMTRVQRAYVEHLVPQTRGRVFTLKEFARAALSSGSTDWSEITAQARFCAAAETRDHDDDLADPYGGPLEGYFVMMKQADMAIAALGGARP